MSQVDALQTKFTADYAKQEFANFTVNNEVSGRIGQVSGVLRERIL